MRRGTLIPLAVSLGLVLLTSLAGSFFTFSAIDTWYSTLTKAALNPPNSVFGPVWTVLYIAMAVAAWRIYALPLRTRARRRALVLYALHLVLNAGWSIAFFGLQSPLLALVIIGLLFLSILTLTIWFIRLDRIAGLLFVPYVAWVAFASYLNLSIVLLN